MRRHGFNPYMYQRGGITQLRGDVTGPGVIVASRRREVVLAFASVELEPCITSDKPFEASVTQVAQGYFCPRRFVLWPDKESARTGLKCAHCGAWAKRDALKCAYCGEEQKEGMRRSLLAPVWVTQIEIGDMMTLMRPVPGRFFEDHSDPQSFVPKSEAEASAASNLHFENASPGQHMTVRFENRGPERIVIDSALVGIYVS
jgi:hypothetical protein